MTALWVLTAVLLAVVLLSLVRVGGTLEYDKGGLRVWARVGRMSFTVYPARERKHKKDRPKREEKQPNEAEKKPKQRNVLDILKEYLPLVAEAAGRLKRRVRVDRLELDLLVGGRDPAATAIAFGWANAALGMMIPLLENNFNIKERQVRTGLDFQGRSAEVRLAAAFSLTIGQGTALGFFIITQLIKITMAQKKTQKEAV